MSLKWRSIAIVILLNILVMPSTYARLISADQWDVEACGKPRRDSGLIVGGSDVRHGQYPWIVAFNQTKIGFSYFCGGTLVSLRHVITAAHCMQPKYGETIFNKFKPSEIIAHFGAHNLSYVNEPGRLSLSPQQILIHNQWNPNIRSYDADIAMLVFESGKIQSTHLIQPICLWSSRNVLVGTEGTVVGWGKSSDPSKKHENVPKKIQVPMFTNEDCFLETHELAQIASKRTFCAGFRNGTGVCLGDSGSGFFIKNDGYYYLRGIVSSSLVGQMGCDVTKYAVYTDVLKFTFWIAYTMREGVQPNETVESQDLRFELKQVNINSWSKTPSISARRISDIKCEEYKNIVATSRLGGEKHALDEGFKTYDCGAVGFAGLIAGGTKAKPGEFPHMAALGYEGNDGRIEFNAAGSLISEKYVLTVAHAKIRRGPTVVRLGELDFITQDDSYATIDIAIKRFIQHPDYNRQKKENDIGLIELSSAVSFDKTFIRPACLQQKEFHGESFIATGWGLTTFAGEKSKYLLKVVLKHQPMSFCAEKFEGFKAELSVKQICAGGVANKGACQGDSGSPLQVPHYDARCVYDIVAFSSFGVGCGSEAPEVFVKVFHYLDWIESIVWP